MSPEYYRHCAEDCCRNAIRVEDIEQRLHWLEAAARWLSLARQQGVLPPIQDNQDLLLCCSESRLSPLELPRGWFELRKISVARSEFSRPRWL